MAISYSIWMADEVIDIRAQLKTREQTDKLIEALKQLCTLLPDAASESPAPKRERVPE